MIIIPDFLTKETTSVIDNINFAHIGSNKLTASMYGVKQFITLTLLSILQFLQRQHILSTKLLNQGF